MIRILLLLVPVMLIYLGIRRLQKTSPQEKHELFKKSAWIVVIIALLMLTGTGKLNVLFAALGVVIASAVRFMPTILRYAPQLHRLWMSYVGDDAKKKGTDRPTGDHRRSGLMSRTEALDVLGLKAGASEDDIIRAHRKLISRLHPDKGGSDYLAAQINLAKKVLLGN